MWSWRQVASQSQESAQEKMHMGISHSNTRAPILMLRFTSSWPVEKAEVQRHPFAEGRNSSSLIAMGGVLPRLML